MAEMLLTDTDSLMYKTDIGNVHEDFYKTKFLLGLDNYSRDSNNYNNSNNLVACKMKDETCIMPTKGFVDLKAEVYTLCHKKIINVKKQKISTKPLQMITKI